MKPLYGYMAGANLGHWISQYGNQSEAHWDSYIVESDIERMRGWGMDHIRVPVDYFLFESDDNPGVYDENRLKYIDNLLMWCKKQGLNLILDLHHAPGFFFGNGAKNDLFTNRQSQLRFINIWKFFSVRYRDEGDNLIFELLNELVWENSDPWNQLWQETAAEIHKLSPNRRIIIGGNNYNNVHELKNLTVVDDDRIIYNFHFYEPFIFTHQRAGWMPSMVAYKTPVAYPFKVADHLAFYGGKAPEYFNGRDVVDKRFLADYMQPVFDFIKEHDKTVYCGEYGVIANADNESAARWLSDMADLMLEHGIGHAVWSYRGFSAITAPDNQSWNQPMVNAISRH